MTSAPGNWSATIESQSKLFEVNPTAMTSLLWPIFLFLCRYQVSFAGARAPFGTTRHFGQVGKRDAAHLVCLIDALALIVSQFENDLGNHTLFSLVIGQNLFHSLAGWNSSCTRMLITVRT